ncbi:Ser/Thr protein phosphatase, putative [Trichomonas vaginalis G3]|uniref:Ser/Thr protein phosphatase, putative n=1 Tax=Trichomonas vaginalis (strain ATCC PRA-98 / G3) TaxID=412133 RepID=A2EN94_TRIV3|nr:metallo-dependent phosphatases family [Trichomonas vaginalis G3]EAY05853.1 Ser/Thr protein phosphatase, putative [Trichomonas vaginalis G3]KAI5531642.1 metallo-dependent phosphatases family [Trichomonas vaginalis G3]|eukprot:XP_001318076.1 Ser/Thr protein phosphatase [Trichomonas vaginalis G3]
MTQSYGDLFGVPLENTSVTIYDLNIDLTVNHRILLISDCHIFNNPQLFLTELQSLINKENPTDLFILGDLINGNWVQGSRVLFQLMQRFQQLKISVFIIGGNHDRYYVEENSSIPGVTLVRDLCMRLSLPQEGISHPLNIYFAHDLCNNFRVRDKHAFSFFEWIKSGVEKIQKEDWLICGHAHTSLLSRDVRIACIGQYSPENNSYGYSILEIIDSKAKLSEKVLLR